MSDPLDTETTVCIDFGLKSCQNVSWVCTCEAKVLFPRIKDHVDVAYDFIGSTVCKRLLENGTILPLTTERLIGPIWIHSSRYRWRPSYHSNVKQAMVTWVLCARCINSLPNEMIQYIAEKLWDTRRDVAWNRAFFKGLQ